MESGLVYMRHRMYDPRTGRFTQMDPVLGNRPHEHYRYAANNPVSMTDPFGTCPFCHREPCKCPPEKTYGVTIVPGGDDRAGRDSLRADLRRIEEERLQERIYALWRKK